MGGQQMFLADLEIHIVWKNFIEETDVLFVLRGLILKLQCIQHRIFTTRYATAKNIRYVFVEQSICKKEALEIFFGESERTLRVVFALMHHKKEKL